MQNDWIIWLSMTEFADNNVYSSTIEQSTFFLNKRFHSWMSFNFDSTEYNITCIKIEVNKAKNIFKHMKWLLKRTKKALINARITMIKQTDKHQKEMFYKVDDMIFMNARNMITTKSLKKLNHKMKESFKIIVKIDEIYRLKLSLIMKIHFEFSLNLLHLNSEDSLEEQWNASLNSIIIEDEEKWEVNDILNFRHYKWDK